jgi:uncharacterized protein
MRVIVDAERSMALISHEITGGAAWSLAVRSGRLVTLTALGDEANLSLLIIAADRLDRLNIPDTLKAQMSACIRPPMVLMSDRGTALASVTSSTLDWHDALTGYGHERHLSRFGPSSYGVDRNEWRRSAATGLLSELTKHGFGQADLHGCINFFTKIEITDDGPCSLSYASHYSSAGDEVSLRIEQDLLLFMSTSAHPMNPSPAYTPPPVRVQVALADPVTADDSSMIFREESARALEQAARVWA